MPGDRRLERGSALQKRAEARERADRPGKQEFREGLLQRIGENQRSIEIDDKRDAQLGVERSLWLYSSNGRIHEVTFGPVVRPGNREANGPMT